MSFQTSSGLTEITTEVACMNSLESCSMLSNLVMTIAVPLEFSMDHLRKENSWLSSFWRTSHWIE